MKYKDILEKKEDIKEQNERLKKFFNSNENIEEKDIIKFFSENEMLIYLIPIVYSLVTKYNLKSKDEFKIKTNKEKQIKGQHRTDYTVVSELIGGGHNICLIEIENAGVNSIFKKDRSGRRQSPEWSSRFEHGYSQILDWLYSINNMSDKDIINEFSLGVKHIEKLSFSSILIIGKKTNDDKEEEKIKWREENICIKNLSRDSKARIDDTKIFIVTLANLHDAILSWIKECDI